MSQPTTSTELIGTPSSAKACDVCEVRQPKRSCLTNLDTGSAIVVINSSAAGALLAKASSMICGYSNVASIRRGRASSSGLIAGNGNWLPAVSFSLAIWGVTFKV